MNFAMKRKTAANLPIILKAGTVGILTGRNVTEGLVTLQILQNLETLGMKLTGNSLSICKLLCDQSLFEKIRKYEKRHDGILILKTAKKGEKEISGRFRRKAVLQMVEIIVAVCSEPLFFMIDQKPESFQLLTLAEAEETCLKRTSPILESLPETDRKS